MHFQNEPSGGLWWSLSVWGIFVCGSYHWDESIERKASKKETNWKEEG